MTWRQRHTVDICNIPRADNKPTAVRICFDFVNYHGDLVNPVLASSHSGTHWSYAGAFNRFSRIEQTRLTCDIGGFASPAFGLCPVPPLFAINRSQVTIPVRPLVPNCYFILAQVLNISFAPQKPEQLVDNRFDMELLCREQWESRTARPQIEPCLRAEDRQCASAGAIRFRLAMLEKESKKIMILPHAKSYRASGLRQVGT